MGGTMFLMWLGEQITSRGIGNGSSLIIFAGIVAAFPSAIVSTLELGRQGAISTGLILGVIVMAIFVIGFIVFVERAQRRLLITYPKRQHGNRVYEGQTSFLPLKLNTAGVIPPIFASCRCCFCRRQSRTSRKIPAARAFLRRSRNISGTDDRSTWWPTSGSSSSSRFSTPPSSSHPTETADNLKKHGGFIPGIRPGERTAQYIDQVLMRITVIGAAYLAIICLIPEALISYAAMPFYFGGTSL